MDSLFGGVVPYIIVIFLVLAAIAGFGLAASRQKKEAGKIETEKRDRVRNFTVRINVCKDSAENLDLQNWIKNCTITHEQCYGGEITASWGSEFDREEEKDLTLKCRRCGVYREIYISVRNHEANRLNFIKFLMDMNQNSIIVPGIKPYGGRAEITFTKL